MKAPLTAQTAQNVDRAEPAGLAADRAGPAADRAGLAADRTFDRLAEADLEQIYRAGKDEALRDRAFRILLAHADTVPKLVHLAFDGERGLTGWTTQELLEISNRFRLLSAPENEIRLYQQCQDEAFRRAPRVREFYVLALNRAGRPAEAIREAAEMMSKGSHSPILWGALAQSYSARMVLAEAWLAQPVPPSNAAAELAAQFATHFPEVEFASLTAAHVQALRQHSLAAATRIFRQGFSETGMSYSGLGWMFRTIDQLCDGVIAQQAAVSRGDPATQIQLIVDEVAALKDALICQTKLIDAALELQGGRESLDYWTHIGQVQVAIVREAPLDEFQDLVARAIAAIDAEFKFSITLPELHRMRDQFVRISRATAQMHVDPTANATANAQVSDGRTLRADIAIQALEAGRAQFKAGAATRQRVESATDAHALFLRQTINFRALIGNLLPLYIEGTIGRVGARVPDLLINRRVQQDLIDLVEGKVLQPLSAAERNDPRAVIARIQQVVGSGLNLSELQDLQSPAHAIFDVRSDGLIALSGVDFDLRRDSRTSTDLTAALLMQTGDCRETMYLNGALFACWQRLQTRAQIARAMLCLDLGYREGFERIAQVEIPAILRYQLRGGQAAVFVDAIAMRGKYETVRRSAEDKHALLRPYGVAEWRAGQPLSNYELEHAIIEVAYTDGRVVRLEPKDPTTGRWQPLGHDGAGVPIVPDASAVTSLRVLHLVEEHALTFFYDAEQRQAELCDGFYNERLFDSPYAFSQGMLNLAEMNAPAQLLRAGNRTLMNAASEPVQQPVYLRFLHFSRTDYAAGLLEGDMPETVQLMGRLFRADLLRERRRLEERTSPIPALLDKIQAWQLGRDATANEHRTTLDRQLTRLMLELAKAHPELVQFKEVSADQVLIQEGAENAHIYLVLSGHLEIYRAGAPLCDQTGAPMVVAAGGVVGEITVLRGGLATATVRGNAVVLGITRDEIRAQLTARPALRESMQRVADYRLEVLTDNGYAVVDAPQTSQSSYPDNYANQK